MKTFQIVLSSIASLVAIGAVTLSLMNGSQLAETQATNAALVQQIQELQHAQEGAKLEKLVSDSKDDYVYRARLFGHARLVARDMSTGEWSDYETIEPELSDLMKETLEREFQSMEVEDALMAAVRGSQAPAEDVEDRS